MPRGLEGRRCRVRATVVAVRDRALLLRDVAVLVTGEPLADLLPVRRGAWAAGLAAGDEVAFDARPEPGRLAYPNRAEVLRRPSGEDPPSPCASPRRARA